MTPIRFRAMVAMTPLRFVATILMLAVFARPGMAAERIPALRDVPATIAQTHPDLVGRRTALLRERSELHRRFEAHNARCRSVEAESSQDAACIAARDELSTALQQHIADSNLFNAAVESANSACVQDAGYQLVFALRDCNSNQPPTLSFACLKGTGVSEESLACLGSAASGSLSALAACGIMATIPLDAAARCRDIKDVCISQVLQQHKFRAASCQR